MPETATAPPVRAVLRRSSSLPSRALPIAVALKLVLAACTTLPPAIRAPKQRHASARPSTKASRSTRVTSGPSCAATSSGPGSAPIAARSERLVATVRQPTSASDIVSRRQCVPSARLSTEATVTPAPCVPGGRVVARRHEDVARGRVAEALDDARDQPELTEPSDAHAWSLRVAAG